MLRILIPLAIFLISLPLAALAFKEGPYPNVTGGFGEQTCHLCHLDNDLNAPGGTLEVTGVPATYAAGQTYSIGVTLSRSGMRRGGFEIAARFANGKRKGRQAGTWRVTNDRMQLIPGASDRALTFVQHNLAGSRVVSTGTNAWTIDWTAPSPASGPILFNVAANASNNDDSPLGDYIYVRALRTIPVR